MASSDVRLDMTGGVTGDDPVYWAVLVSNVRPAQFAVFVKREKGLTPAFITQFSTENASFESKPWLWTTKTIKTETYSQPS